MSRPGRTAIALDLVAGVAVLAGGAYALRLRIHIEPTSVALYHAYVGSHLMGMMGAAALILIVGVVASLALPRPSASIVASVIALVVIAESFIGVAHARSQLHPSLAGERAALATFPVPAGTIGPTESEIAGYPQISAQWLVQGAVATVCPAAESELRSWADPNTVRTTAPPTPRLCGWVAGKGSDDVVLYAFLLPSESRVTISLLITHREW